MKLLPHDTFTLETLDLPPVVRDRLAARVEPYKAVRWGFSHNHAPYQGRISDEGFEIQRIIHYRNSFLPRIRGKFEPLASGTAVRISMGLHPLVTGFLAFWYLTWYSAIVPLALTGAMPGETALLFVGMPILTGITFWGAFWYEAGRSRRDLTQYIQGKAV
ncbi:MAG: hypothetical protein SW833_06835 [Cyanobacteriota bacterium]|nr:hypothetical protein [Cyanobacteriota bacterium]